jgi:hypothetical protein
LLISAAIDATEERHVYTGDVEGAFLHAFNTKEIYIRLDPQMSAILCALHPEYEPYLDKNGELVPLAIKAIYGTIEAALLFNIDLTTKLKDFGFKQNPYDPCVLNRMMHGNQVTVTIHVDDLKISSRSKQACEETIQYLTKMYKNINVHFGKKLDYLGMTFDYSDKGSVGIKMKSHIDDV